MAAGSTSVVVAWLVTIVTSARSARRTCCPTCWASTRTRSGTRHRRNPPTARRTRPHHPPDHAAFHHRRRTGRLRRSSNDEQRSVLPDLLADPGLTGMPRSEFTAFTRTRRAHLRRTRRAAPLPPPRRGTPAGARGGVFRQKISNAERVLATVLYQRKLCSQDTLADLFHVSRRTIGDVVREVGPILAQNGDAPAPATQRFATAAALLASLAPHEDAATPAT